MIEEKTIQIEEDTKRSPIKNINRKCDHWKRKEDLEEENALQERREQSNIHSNDNDILNIKQKQMIVLNMFNMKQMIVVVIILNMKQNNKEWILLSLTKNVDIFSLGCILSFLLSIGHHPYGGRLIDQHENMDNDKQYDLISWIIKPKQRPDSKQRKNHACFSNEQILLFLNEQVITFKNHMN